MTGCRRPRPTIPRPRGIVAAAMVATMLLTLTGCPWDKPPKPEAAIATG